MRYRVYYNRTENEPQVWSVDEGDQSTEINVTGIKFHGVDAVAHRVGSWVRSQPGLFTPGVSPTGWFSVESRRVEIRGGWAHFRPVRAR